MTKMGRRLGLGCRESAASASTEAISTPVHAGPTIPTRKALCSTLRPWRATV
jgi:hypothetical protein